MNTSTIYCICFTILSYIFGTSCQANVWNINDVPNPTLDPLLCGSDRQQSFVCDPNRLMSRDEVENLNRLIDSVKGRTNCMCSENKCDLDPKGAKVAIAIIKEMDVGNRPDRQSDDYVSQMLQNAATFAQGLQARWAFDQCEDGILIFYSRNDNMLYTHTSKEVHKHLKNDVISEISMRYRGSFLAGNYYQGFYNMTTDFMHELRQEYTRHVNDVPQNPRAAAMVQVPESTASSTFSLLATVSMLLVAALLHL